MARTLGLAVCALAVACISVAAKTRILQQNLQPTVPISTPKNPVLVNAPLAESTKPKQACPEIDNNAVDPSTLMPSGSPYFPVFSLQSTGLRNYSCVDGRQLDLNSLAIANFTGDFVGESSYNADRLPQLTMRLPDGTPAGSIIVDSDKMTFNGLGESFKWARWPLLLISGPYVPWHTWVTMVNTTGGAPPSAESCQGQQWLTVPYEATYTYWSC